MKFIQNQICTELTLLIWLFIKFQLIHSKNLNKNFRWKKTHQFFYFAIIQTFLSTFFVEFLRNVETNAPTTKPKHFGKSWRKLNKIDFHLQLFKSEMCLST